MPANKKLISALKNNCQSQADAAIAQQQQSYMKSVMPFYGIKMPAIRATCKDVFSQYPLKDSQNWQDTVLLLWRKAKYREERHCAILLCEAKQYRDFQTLDTLPLYEEMIVSGAWWDYVDVIASHRIGHLLEHYPKEMKKLLKIWSVDDDIWKRRTAILSQLSFKDTVDLKFLYACIKPSLSKDEFFLQKAIGWALRSYAWQDINEVQRYVREYDNKLSKLAKREALKNQHKLMAKN